MKLRRCLFLLPIHVRPIHLCMCTVREGTIVNRFVRLDIEGTRYRFYIMVVYLFSNGLLNTLGMFIAFQTQDTLYVSNFGNNLPREYTSVLQQRLGLTWRTIGNVSVFLPPMKSITARLFDKISNRHALSSPLRSFSKEWRKLQSSWNSDVLFETRFNPCQ